MDVPPFCAALPKQLKLLSGLLACCPFFFGITLHYWRHFLDIVNVLQIWSTLAVCQEFAAGFEPSRNGKIFYKSLPEINVIYFLFIKWEYSSWQKHKCFVLSRYHIFHRNAISKRYVSFFKILYHLLFKVSRATNKGQNVWNVWTKVSDETCCSGHPRRPRGR